jgi:hypothetical protein
VIIICEAVCKGKENIICSDVVKCTESNPIVQAIHGTERMEVHLWQIAAAASAKLSAIRRKGLSEVVMCVVR